MLDTQSSPIGDHTDNHNNNHNNHNNNSNNTQESSILSDDQQPPEQHQEQYHHSSAVTDDRQSHDSGTDEDAPRRGIEYRQYIKEKLMGHKLWKDGNFWEQALWQCAIEQVTPYKYNIYII
jgi:hypothetical protein